jgi:hypothetical protein
VSIGLRIIGIIGLIVGLLLYAVLRFVDWFDEVMP